MSDVDFGHKPVAEITFRKRGGGSGRPRNSLYQRVFQDAMAQKDSGQATILPMPSAGQKNGWTPEMLKARAQTVLSYWKKRDPELYGDLLVRQDDNGTVYVLHNSTIPDTPAP